MNENRIWVYQQLRNRFFDEELWKWALANHSDTVEEISQRVIDKLDTMPNETYTNLWKLVVKQSLARHTALPPNNPLTVAEIIDLLESPNRLRCFYQDKYSDGMQLDVDWMYDYYIR